MVPPKDVSGRSHSLGELTLNHEHLASWVEDLAVAGGEGGYWPPYIGELWDADAEGSSESVSAVDRWVQIFEAVVWDVAEGGRRRWPSNSSELIVFMADMATVGHSMRESTSDARSHRFLLNN